MLNTRRETPPPFKRWTYAKEKETLFKVTRLTKFKGIKYNNYKQNLDEKCLIEKIRDTK